MPRTRQVWFSKRTVTTYHLFEDCPHRKKIDPDYRRVTEVDVGKDGLPIEEPDSSSEICSWCLREENRERREIRKMVRDRYPRRF